jgi:glycogen debranching enzyme
MTPYVTTDPVRSEEVRFFPPRTAPILRATDLGSVQVLKHGNLYLLTDAFGDIHEDARGLGLYRNDSRLLSCSILRVAGERPVVLQTSVGGNYRGGIQLTNPSADRNQDAKVHPLDELVGRTVGISRERLIGGDGMRERLRVVNHGATRLSLPVVLTLGVDGADIFEVRGYPRDGRGRVLPIAATDRRVTFRYDGLDGVRRSTHLAFTDPATARPAELDEAGASVSVEWTLDLEPGAVRDVGWTIWSSERPVPRREDDETTREDALHALFPAVPRVDADEGASAYHAWERGTTLVDSDHELFDLVVKRSVADLRLLMNDGPGPDERYIAAGVPWFATLFGRDAILAAFQALPFRPQLAVETLTVLAAHQATEDDPWRDAEPGKILHELRSGELARAGELPHTPYYGSVDSTPLWLVLLGATFDWTGDLALLDRLWPHAMAALEWIDRHGDLDGDGFIEYARRSERGLVNQGWKDSSDAIRDRSGREAASPIALAEVQGYVFDAKRRLAGLARIRGDQPLAVRLDAEAAALQERFEAAFWVEDLRYYAMALDGDKRPADAIGSNAGHCLWSGIVGTDRARDVVEALFRPSMFSGWGIRTYAAGQPGYNPIGYHTGTVWPHDTAIVAAGLKRYGFDDASNRLVGEVFEAAQRFPDYRLPELFCGFDREDAHAPVPYPVACSPQAWAAAAPFLFLTTMLGLRAYAERGELELHHPHLPEWLGRVTIKDLRVGEASVDLLFHRWRGTTSAEVIRKVGDLDITVRL